VSIFIESSKTYQYRDGAWLVIAKTGTMLCPGVNLIKCLTWAKIKDDSDMFIFCRLTKNHSGYELGNVDKHISYTTLRQLFIEALKAMLKMLKIVWVTLFAFRGCN
jgi:hypothetical protein